MIYRIQQGKKFNGKSYYCKKGHIARECRKQKHDKEFEQKNNNSQDCGFIITTSGKSDNQVSYLLSEVPSRQQGVSLLNNEMQDV